MGTTLPLLTMIVVGFGLAFILGMIAHYFKLSPIVGYLLAGVLIGPATPGYSADPKIALELAEIGVILLMFGVGLHFSWKDLMQVKKIAIPGALCQIAIAMAMGWGLAHWAEWNLSSAVIYGLSLSVASTVVLLRALQERKLLKTDNGQIAIGWLIVEDLIVVMALVVLPAIAHFLKNVETPAVDMAKLNDTLAWALGIMAVKVIGFALAMILIGKRIIPWILHIAGKTHSAELFRLAVLAIALGVAFASAKFFGISFALGAFFSGMILSESKFNLRAERESTPLRDAFTVLFFVSMGMLLSPAIIFTEPLLIVGTVIVIVFGKSLAAFIIVLAFGYPKTTALTISVSLAQIGEFSFILAELGRKLDILTLDQQDIILAGAIISILLNPLLLKLLPKDKHAHSTSAV